MAQKELGILYPIKIVEYDDRWPHLFEKEKGILFNILGSEIALRIEHIGSTAIPGLSAKPTVDILIEIPKNIEKDQIKKIMTRNKYIFMEEQSKHIMFVKGYSPTGLEKESYHIHMGPADQAWLWDRIYFRDYLRKNRSEAMQYESHKNELASRYKHDREAYTEKKADYIKRITELAKQEIKIGI